MELVRLGLMWGTVFGLVFCPAVLVIGRINVEMLVNSYPPDIRARWGPISPTARRQASRAALVLLTLLTVVILVALDRLRDLIGELTFLDTLLVTTLMLQTWNLLDLVQLDWLLLMTLKPQFMIPPRTEGMAGYRNYAFHLRQFVNGVPLSAALALATTLIAVTIERLM